MKLVTKQLENEKRQKTAKPKRLQSDGKIEKKENVESERTEKERKEKSGNDENEKTEKGGREKKGKNVRGESGLKGKTENGRNEKKRKEESWKKESESGKRDKPGMNASLTGTTLSLSPLLAQFQPLN